VVQTNYPALFPVEEIINEYEMVISSIKAIKMGRQQGPKVVLMAESMSPDEYDTVPKKLTQKQNLTEEILKMLNLTGNDDDDVDEVQFRKALIDLLLLPVLLGDNTSLV
jgi:hypothetical protein